MAIDKSTVARIRSNLEAFRMAKATNKNTPLELEVMEARLGELFIRHGEEILGILEAYT